MADDLAADYFAFGIHLRSELELPELNWDEAAGRGAPTANIRIGETGSHIEDARYIGPTFQVGLDDYLLTVPNIARYRVCRGEEITVEPFAGSAAHDVRLFLLGTALRILVHQRRLLPLHASAISVDGRCVAFVGTSRAGKSTLAAHFGGRGYPILEDDLCVLSFPKSGPPLAWPGVPRLKLWQAALTALGRDSEGLSLLRSGLQKFHVPLNGLAYREPLPLARIYVLSEAVLPSHTGINRLSGSAAFNMLRRHSYRPRILSHMGCAPDCFRNCASVLQHVPLFVAWRKWGFDHFSASTEELERHFRTEAT